MIPKQAPKVMRSGLTGTWFVVTRYKDLGEGRIEAIEKHAVHEESARDLEAFHSAWVDQQIRSREVSR